MTRIKCRIDYVTLDGDYGTKVQSVMATCSRCGKTTESFGTSTKSIKRCLFLMNKDCKCREDNLYVKA
jgi:hypothetical protein